MTRATCRFRRRCCARVTRTGPLSLGGVEAPRDEFGDGHPVVVCNGVAAYLIEPVSPGTGRDVVVHGFAVRAADPADVAVEGRARGVLLNDLGAREPALTI